MAKRLLNAQGLKYQQYDVTDGTVLADEMRKRSNQLSVPQIFLNDEHIGGFEQLTKAIRSGDFMAKIEAG
jgi:glutaredoxin 3